MPRTKQFDEKEVLKKAMELFWEKGFHATSMQDLVSGLGINRASLYDTFGGKRALFEKAFSLYRNTNIEVVEDLLRSESKIKEGFRKLFDLAIEQTVNDSAQKGCFVVNTATEMIPGDGALLNTLLSNKAKAEQIFADYIQMGIEKEQIDHSKNAQNMASFLFTLYNGFRVVAKIDADPEKLRNMVEVGLEVLD